MMSSGNKMSFFFLNKKGNKKEKRFVGLGFKVH